MITKCIENARPKFGLVFSRDLKSWTQVVTPGGEDVSIPVLIGESLFYAKKDQLFRFQGGEDETAALGPREGGRAAGGGLV